MSLIKLLNIYHSYNFFNTFLIPNSRYIKGESLCGLMKLNEKPFNEPQMMNVLLRMIDAIEYIHSNSILHMDIKPGNILMDINAYNKLYVKDSRGLFVYPDSLFLIAKGTGWYDTNLTDKQNSERLMDTVFISWLNNRVKKEFLNNNYHGTNKMHRMWA